MTMVVMMMMMMMICEGKTAYELAINEECRRAVAARFDDGDLSTALAERSDAVQTAASVNKPGNTAKPVLFACPLFCKFRDLVVFAKITGRKYIFYQQSISSASRNAKIKGSQN